MLVHAQARYTPPAPTPRRVPPAHAAPGAPAKLKVKPRASLPAPPAWQALAADLGRGPGPHTLTYAPGAAVFVLSRPDALSHLVVAELAEVMSLAGDGDRVNVLTSDGQRRRPRGVS